MKEFSYTIKDELGIHARPAGILVKEAKEFSSEISIEKDGKKGNMKMIFSLMGMGIKCGDTVKITIEGEDEDAALSKIENIFKENL